MDAERTGKRGPHQADTPPRVGNYVTARVGNYVTDNPSNLGKYVTADIEESNIAFSFENRGLHHRWTAVDDAVPDQLAQAAVLPGPAGVPDGGADLGGATTPDSGAPEARMASAR